jgi:hypothetical protein
MAHQEAPNTTIASAKNLSMISTYQAAPLYRSEEFLRDRYLKERLSTGQIAREIRSARSSVLEGLRAYGIPLRPEEEAHQLSKGQLAYGEKMTNGHIVPHKGEEKVIREIVGMRNEGLSYGAIANWLNKEGHPTKNRVKGWDRPTVYKILSRVSDRHEITCRI